MGNIMTPKASIESRNKLVFFSILILDFFKQIYKLFICNLLILVHSNFLYLINLIMKKCIYDNKVSE